MSFRQWGDPKDEIKASTVSSNRWKLEMKLGNEENRDPARDPTHNSSKVSRLTPRIIVR